MANYAEGAVYFKRETGAAVTKNRFVKLNASGLLIEAADNDTDDIIGVSAQTVASGATCSFAVQGVVELEISAAATAGAGLKGAASGRAKVTADGDTTKAHLYDTTTAANQTARVLLTI